MTQFWYEVVVYWFMDGSLEAQVLSWLMEMAVLNGVCQVFHCWA